jgi:predicted nucleotidyltransferase
MRISKKEIDIIKNKVNDIFGSIIIYLFGSRRDDTKKGGDIDLFVVPKINDDLYKKKLRLKFVLENILYKPVDIVVSKNKDRLIEQEAQKGIII